MARRMEGMEAQDRSWREARRQAKKLLGTPRRAEGLETANDSRRTARGVDGMETPDRGWRRARCRIEQILSAPRHSARRKTPKGCRTELVVDRGGSRLASRNVGGWGRRALACGRRKCLWCSRACEEGGAPRGTGGVWWGWGNENHETLRKPNTGYVRYCTNMYVPSGHVRTIRSNATDFFTVLQ